ncbi:MAG TPA: glycosyltransferase family 2 protein [Pyrinomonadaceae bacterium]|jgi:GT2 family glycosyltransferase
MMRETVMSKSNLIRVEVVFPVHNRRELTLLCLRSLARIDSENLDVHVVMVDDGSTDGTSEAVENEFPGVEIVKGDGNLWFTEGTNAGVRAALRHNPEYVLMMNDDQIFDSQFLRFMVETAEKYPRSIVGSLLLLWDTPHKLFQVSPRWETFSGGWRHWVHQTIWTIPKKPWEVGIIVGNCLLVPAEAIQECGLMDSKRFPNFGDAEYTPRMKKNGWRLLIEPRARVFCQPNTIPSKIAKMSLKEKYNALFVNLKAIQNQRRRFYACLAAAPTRLHGLTAFFALYARVFLKMNPEGDWAQKQKEKSIAEMFAHAVVKD